MKKFAPRTRRRSAALMAAAAVAALGATALPSVASAVPDVVSGATYNIVPDHTSGAMKALEVQNASTSAGARIVQNHLNSSRIHQRFTITQAGSTGGGRPYFRIRDAHVTGMCFDVEGASLASGARVIQFPCISGNRNQQFFLDSILPGFGPIFPGGTTHWITPRHSGLKLDVVGASTVVGAELQQFVENGGRNQLFMLRRVG